MTSEAGSEVTGSTTNSSNTVILSSNFCGVKSGAPTSINASINLRSNAHHGVPSSNANSLQTSQCSSMLDRQQQHSMNSAAASHNGSSNSQSAQLSPFESGGGDPIWSGINEGSQGNQSIIGAKSASSDMHQSAPVNHSNMNGQLDQDIRTSECRERFGNETISGNSNQITGAASLGRPFLGCNGGGGAANYGNGHSMNSQQSHMMGGNDNFHNPNSFGAQYGSSSQAHRPNSQVVSDANSSSFSGWQGPNLSANPSYKGWNNIPDPGRTSSYLSHPNANDNSGQRANCNNTNNNGGSAITNRESSSDIYEGLIGAAGSSHSTNEELSSRNGNNPNQRDSASWGMPPQRPMGLLGGGDNGINNGGWGGPPTSSYSMPPPTSSWSTRHEQGDAGPPKPPPPNSWAQAAGSSKAATPGEGVESTNPPPVEKLRISTTEEPDIKLVAAYSDGWGQAGVNQDTMWDVPLSPQPSSKEGAPLWRPQANNGTDIWETNVRHRSKAPAAPPAQQQPWGHHTPSSHIGGTWGEEEENPNMWTGVPPPPQHTPSNWEEGRNIWGGGNKPQNPPPWSGPAPIKKENNPPQPSGWEEPSPPTNRRMGNFDDGTAVWGNPGRQGKVSHWKEPNKAPSMTPPAGMIRLPPGATGKPESMWGNKGPRGGNWGDNTWEDPAHSTSLNKNSPSFGWGGEQASPLNAYWGAKPKSVAHSNSWSEGQIDTSSWGGPSKLVSGRTTGSKPLSKDLIWASKQFRILTELGHKKDDVENALRNNNMILEDALSELQASNPGMMRDNMMMDKGRDGPEEMCMGDSSGLGDGNFHNFQGSQVLNPNFGAGGGFKSQIKGSSNTPASLLNNACQLGVPASSLNLNGQLPPIMVQKVIQQQHILAAQASLAANSPNHLARLPLQNMPSTHLLRYMIQQIQMAVQAGHLNPQIMNYPLAPQTWQFLFQLLGQIKALQQLQQQYGGGGQKVSPQVNVQITQTKQRINNLQNQIAAQQAMFLKQHPHQHLGMPPQHSVDPFKSNLDPNMPSLHSEFRDLSLKDNSQSRLNQWKLPSFEKEDNSASNAPSSASQDFSRAPGSVSKSSMNLMGSQNEGTWARSSQESSGGSWPDSAPQPPSVPGPGEKEGSPPTTATPPTPTTSSSYNLTDLVPEFEPGKPWKGTSQMKNIEDDPHLTPGSVAKSPLSVNTIKDSDLFSWTSKGSPMTGDNNLVSSLVSNPWAFTPTTSTALPNNTSGKPTNLKVSGWGPLENTGGTDLWGGSISKNRGPPPGLAVQNKGGNSWGRTGWSGGCGGWDRQANSTFLVIRNLTPQIDGSTLKTLCMQHGPLQLFHLFLNHGIALARYSTREEASKAQSALNNCVLGNTTILVDIPTEAEVQQYLQLGAHAGGWSGNGRTSANTTFPPSATAAANGKATDSWSSGNSSAMWSFSNMWEHDPNAANPTSFLPGDLLGGESM